MNQTAGRVESVVRAMNIIKCLARGDEKSLVAIAREVGLHVATTRRLLLTLVDSEFLWQNPESKKYSLGIPLLTISQKLGARQDLRQIARPYLRELMEKAGETANLAIKDKGEVVYIEQAECSNYLRTANKVGSRAPLYCTAVGKILLSAASHEETEKYLLHVPLVPYTPKTIVNPNKLRCELERVARKNLVLDHEEQMIGERCLAVGIRNSTGKVVAAISISGPVFRLTPRRLRELTPMISEIGERLSREIGFGEQFLAPKGSQKKNNQGELNDPEQRHQRNHRRNRYPIHPG